MSRDELGRLVARVERVGAYDDPWMVPEERRLELYLCRDPRQSLQEVWPILGPRWD